MLTGSWLTPAIRSSVAGLIMRTSTRVPRAGPVRSVRITGLASNAATPPGRRISTGVSACSPAATIEARCACSASRTGALAGEE